MIKSRGIQYDVVAALANSLVGQGFKPEEISAGAIREETRTGSLSTIMAHLKRWRGQSQSATPAVELTSDKMAAVAAAVRALVTEASEEVRNEARKANAAVEIERARIRAELEEALALNEQIEAERETALAEADALRAKVEEVSLREARLQGQLEALTLALGRFDQAPSRSIPPVQKGPQTETAPDAKREAPTSSSSSAAVRAEPGAKQELPSAGVSIAHGKGGTAPGHEQPAVPAPVELPAPLVRNKEEDAADPRSPC